MTRLGSVLPSRSTLRYSLVYPVATVAPFVAMGVAFPLYAVGVLGVVSLLTGAVLVLFGEDLAPGLGGPEGDVPGRATGEGSRGGLGRAAPLVHYCVVTAGLALVGLVVLATRL